RPVFSCPPLNRLFSNRRDRHLLYPLIGRCMVDREESILQSESPAQPRISLLGSRSSWNRPAPLLSKFRSRRKSRQCRSVLGMCVAGCLSAGCAVIFGKSTDCSPGDGINGPPLLLGRFKDVCSPAG